jgi:hypothetical protein
MAQALKHRSPSIRSIPAFSVTEGAGFRAVDASDSDVVEAGSAPGAIADLVAPAVLAPTGKRFAARRAF